MVIKGAYIIGKSLGKVAGKASMAHVHSGWIAYKASGVVIKGVVVAVKVGLGILGGAAIGHTMMGD